MFNEALLRVTQRLAKVGGWAVTLGTEGKDGSVFWTPGTFEIYECEGNISPTYSEVMNCIRPQYRAITFAQMADCEERGIPGEFEVEILTFKGTAKFIRVALEPQLDDAGRVVGIV